MTKQDIFKTVINALRSEEVRCMMEYNINKATDAIVPVIEAAGLVFVGIGMYSVVVEHPKYPGRVFKVSTSRWDGFREYAKYCTDNSNKPFVPAIYSAEVKGNFAWYEMDKYFSIMKADESDFVSNKADEMYSFANAGQYGSSLREEMDVQQDRMDIYNFAKELESAYGSRFTLDIHTGNIMMDVFGNFFITDPLAGDLRREIPVLEEDPVF